MIYTITLNPALDRELTVPEIHFDDVLRATALRIDYGGKGFNVSRALRKLGRKTVALGFVGGSAGHKISFGLTDLGIATDFVDINGETRTNISIVSERAARYIKVNESGPVITLAEQEELLAKVEDLARAEDWWVLSGSLPRGVPDTFYADIIERVQREGGKAVVDTSGASLARACEARPFLVKPNAFEAEELTGIPVTSPADAEAALAAIHQLGVARVFITFGKDGALLSDGRHRWLATSPAIEESNPIGAGDSAVAGLMWGLSSDLPLPEALCWGVACGAAAASLPGTAVGDYTLVSSLFENVDVTEL